MARGWRRHCVNAADSRRHQRKSPLRRRHRQSHSRCGIRHDYRKGSVMTAVTKLTRAHTDAIHTAAVMIDNAREDRDEAIRQAYRDGIAVSVIAKAAEMSRQRVYQILDQ